MIGTAVAFVKDKLNDIIKDCKESVIRSSATIKADTNYSRVSHDEASANE